MRIFLQIMYDGSGFSGWQIQPGKSTVQGEITAAIKSLTGEDVSLVGSGRTDAGVHAIAQTAHFDLTRPFDVSKIIPGLNFYLPPFIRISGAKIVPGSFNARFSAVGKTYFYLTYFAKTDNPLLLNKALRLDCADLSNLKTCLKPNENISGGFGLKIGFDLNAVNIAASMMIGTHDFKPFMSSGSDVSTTVRTVTDCRVYACNNLVASGVNNLGESFGASFLVFQVSANGFLYNMVRKMTAVLISVGQGKRTVSDVSAILENGKQVKDIAPAHGLYLKNVEYPPEFALDF